MRTWEAKLARGFHDRGLQPVDADRLLVAHVILETDIDKIPGLDHLLGRLREAGFVAVDRRDVEEAGQKEQHSAEQQKRDRAGMA